MSCYKSKGSAVLELVQCVDVNRWLVEGVLIVLSELFNNNTLTSALFSLVGWGISLTTGIINVYYMYSGYKLISTRS